MAREFGIVYPNNRRISLEGGLNSKFPAANIADNESQNCANVVYANGAVETRGGAVKLNTTPIGSFTCDGLYTRRESDGTESMIVFANSQMWTLEGTSTFTTVTSADSIFTAGVRVACTQYQDHAFFGNGNGDPHKWNGDHFTRHGVPAPNSGPTASGTSAGGLSGTYSYRFSYVNSALVEGDVSSNTTALTVSAKTIGLTSIPVAPQSFGVNARRIYRTEAGGTSWKRVAEIADNTTTTYADNLADTALGALAPVDNGEPPNWSVATYHQGRLWMNDVNNVGFVWYSEIGNPYVVESTSFLRVGDATSDIVQGLTIHQNSILVACESSLWLIYLASADPNDWSIIRIKSPYGTMAPWGMVGVNESIMFPAFERGKFVGFAAVKGDAVAPDVTLTTEGAAGSSLQSQRIEPDMFDMRESTTLWRRMSAVVWKNRAWFSVPFQSIATENNRIYVYDFSIEQVTSDNRPAWIPFTGLSAEMFTIYNRKLYFASSLANGFVYEADTTTYSDDGVAIDSYIWTKEFSGYGRDAHLSKDFRSLFALVENAGNWQMTIGARSDSDKGVGTSYTIPLDPGGTLWGSFVFATDTWGGGLDRHDVSQFLGTLKGRRVSFKFSNQNVAGQWFRLHNFAFSYNIRGER